MVYRGAPREGSQAAFEGEYRQVFVENVIRREPRAAHEAPYGQYGSASLPSAITEDAHARRGCASIEKSFEMLVDPARGTREVGEFTLAPSQLGAMEHTPVAPLERRDGSVQHFVVDHIGYDISRHPGLVELRMDAYQAHARIVATQPNRPSPPATAWGCCVSSPGDGDLETTSVVALVDLVAQIAQVERAADGLASQLSRCQPRRWRRPMSLEILTNCRDRMPPLGALATLE